jgi:hypothetical protein
MPRGWSKPVKPAEVSDLFPWAASVVWDGRPQTWKTGDALPVVWVVWEPKSKMAQPVLTLWAVPSSLSSTIRQQVHDEIAPEAARWMDAVLGSGEVSRATAQRTGWAWAEPGGLLRRPPASKAARVPKR